ncbi:MAG: PAS domain S-box protein [Desulfuromonadaceae bacterium]
MNVLIVDDNSDSLYMLESLFRGHGCTAYSAGDGIAALEIIRTEPVEVIVSDVLMPRMDGFQLCRSVKTDSRLRHIPFIVYTATYTSPQDESYARKLGAERFIQKPSEPEEFLATVRTVVKEAESKTHTVTHETPMNEEESLRLYSERLAERLQLKVDEVEQELQARRAAEQRLHESEKMFRSLMENVDDLVYAGSSEGVFTYVSPNWKDDLGIDPDNVIGQPFSVFEPYLHPDDANNCWGIAPAVFNTGESYLSPEYRVLYADGSWRWHVSNAAPLKDRDGRVYGLVGVARDITERKEAEEQLRESEERFRSIYEHTTMGLTQVSLDFRIQHANQAYCDMLGYTPDEIVGMHLKEITQPETLEENLEKQEKLGRGEIDHFRMEKCFKQKDGHTVYGILDANLIRDKEGQPQYFLGSVVDITERKELEQQLLQAQKLESIGRLAGGVAHDYNNMLGVILGSAELALNSVTNDHPVHSKLEQIRSAARRSADITRQLLAFARKQTVAPKVIELNTSLEGMLKMLHRLIGEEIDLSWRPGTNLDPVEIDPVQLDQLLANLCVNARDAISGSGKITIETANVEFDTTYCARHQGFKPGHYVMLAVSDNGCGMDKQTQANIYEPFYTTKDTGKGTGLGLATVYGIVKQNQGFINLYSEPGSGTTFRIYLPRHAQEAAAEPETPQSPALPAGHGQQILVVEDEPTMLELTSMMLEELGYQPIQAGTPAEALELAQQNPEITLLLTDVVMPGMNGRELARQLQEQQPPLKVLYMSGYTANVIAHHGVLEKGLDFIQKPFSLQDLADKMEEVM